MLILDGQHRMLALKTALNEQNELRDIFKKQDEILMIIEIMKLMKMVFQ